MGNEALLKSIVESRFDITSASIISKGKMTEIYGRPELPMPPEADLKRMTLQGELLVGMITTNECVVGDTRFIMILHTDLCHNSACHDWQVSGGGLYSLS